MRVLITGGRDFCEVRDGVDYMDERRALGFALDFVNPSEIIVSKSETGTSRWARIWADKRGVNAIIVGSIQSAIDLSPKYGVCFGTGGEQCRSMGLDVYEVDVK